KRTGPGVYTLVDLVVVKGQIERRAAGPRDLAIADGRPQRQAERTCAELFERRHRGQGSSDITTSGRYRSCSGVGSCGPPPPTARPACIFRAGASTPIAIRHGGPADSASNAASSARG